MGKERGLDVGPQPARAQNLAEKCPSRLDARHVLADQQGIQQFVYTHKGDNAFTILRDLGLDSYFYSRKF